MIEEVEEQVEGERAYDVIKHLLFEIGPRPAGSEAETQTFQWLADELGTKGYSTETRPATFAPRPRFLPFFTIAGLGFLLSAWSLLVFPWISLLLPLLVAGLPEISFWLIRRLPLSGKTANLLVMPPETEVQNLDLLFCAHVDTARAVPPGKKLWYRLRTQSFDVLHRVALILALLGLFGLFGWELPAPVFLAAVSIVTLLALLLLALDLWEQLAGRNTYASGANDNGSGVGVLVELAETLAQQTPQALKVGFLFTGAEETGLHGALSFAREIRSCPQRPMIFNLDMVGAGNALRIITSAGTLRKVKTDEALNQWFLRADPSAGKLTYTRRSGDFLPFLQNGIRASGIESNGTAHSWHAYHTVQDSLSVIDRSMLEHTVRAVKNLVWVMDKDKASSVR